MKYEHPAQPLGQSAADGFSGGAGVVGALGRHPVVRDVAFDAALDAILHTVLPAALRLPILHPTTPKIEIGDTPQTTQMSPHTYHWTNLTTAPQ